ncbi:hypothetical protein A5652_06985 [Mycobacterium sp. 1165178.9]|nr:hypothetical protein A5652_06985 [Mycobacterium sp. 1165178.9]
MCPYLKHVEGLTVQGFGRHGVVLADAQPPQDFLSFGYIDPVDETPCDSKLLTAYEQAVAEDNIDTSSWLHWMDDRPAEMKQLAALAHADKVNWPNLCAAAMPFAPDKRLAWL